MLKNKKILVSLTAMTMAILLMAGTFAWQTMLNKVNEFIGKKTEIIIHDDFDPDTGVKDVFIENPGNREIFVRVKLNEVMNLTSSEKITTGWQTHKYANTFLDCGNYNSAGKYFHDYFKWTMGGSKWYMPGSVVGGVVSDLNNYGPGDAINGAKETPYGALMTVSQYLSMTLPQQKAYIGWICDTVDGYAYWSQPLKKGNVTGLLLNGVETAATLKDTDYYYAIDVIVEAVDLEDLDMWLRGAASVDGSGRHFDEASFDAKLALDTIATLATSITP